MHRGSFTLALHHSFWKTDCCKIWFRTSKELRIAPRIIVNMHSCILWIITHYYIITYIHNIPRTSMDKSCFHIKQYVMIYNTIAILVRTLLGNLTKKAFTKTTWYQSYWLSSDMPSCFSRTSLVWIRRSSSIARSRAPAGSVSVGGVVVPLRRELGEELVATPNLWNLGAFCPLLGLLWFSEGATRTCSERLFGRAPPCTETSLEVAGTEGRDSWPFG